MVINSRMKQPLKVTPPIRLKAFDPGFHAGLEKEATRQKTLQHCQRIGEGSSLFSMELVGSFWA